MRSASGNGRRRIGVAGLAFAVSFALLAPTAPSAVSFDVLDGFPAPGTPDQLNKVGVIKTGPTKARNILILNPGTSASAAYFVPMARALVKEAKGWQVWAIERRENFLEDHTVFDQLKQGMVTAQQVFEYYLEYITDPSITTHFQSIPDSDVAFARDWGMNVEIQDLRRVVQAADQRARRIVMGGHSLGGSITTAYATWDFNGEPGASDLAGLVYDDGGSSPTPITPEEAQQSLDELQAGSPWLAFGGIPAPFAGLFNTVGSGGVKTQPNIPGELSTWELLPDNLKTPVRATAEASYGYALDTETSPPTLAAAQAHLGRLAASGDPRPWDAAGELTPIQRYADMFFGTGLLGRDGTAWYHPRRLTIDSDAIAAGNANPAQDVLGVKAVHGGDLGRIPIYAFAASLGGQRVLDAARALAAQNAIPQRKLTLINRASTYAHNDPASAFPKNAFLKNLVRFLDGIAKRTKD
jgi:pimeloyl-ACP methyl ester carboxylesterase